MKNLLFRQAIAEVAPVTEVDALRAELMRRRTKISDLEGQLTAVTARTAQLAHEIEAAEEHLVRDEINQVTFDGLRADHAEAQSGISDLSSQIRVARRMADKSERELAELEGREVRERRERARRQVLEAVAPVLDAVIIGFNKLLAIEGAGSVIDGWHFSFDNGYPGTRLICALLGDTVRGALGGDRLVILNLCQQLDHAAPDLVSPAIRDFIADSQRVINERFARQQAEEARRRELYPAPLSFPAPSGEVMRWPTAL
jgi:hypothetical protein